MRVVITSGGAVERMMAILGIDALLPVYTSIQDASQPTQALTTY